MFNPYFSLFFNRTGLFFWLFIVGFCQTISAQVALRNLLFNSASNVIRLDFTTDPPTPFPTGLVGNSPSEGVAHYEDGTGALIFWFNSNGVYNATGGQMSGSVGILANSSAAEVVICPKPGDPDKYYIIYNGETCSNLYYSIVDMNLNGGLGNIVPGTLNDVLANGTYAEAMEIIRIPGTSNYWLLAYQCGTGFRRFLIDGTGIDSGQTILSYPTPSGFDGRGELEYHSGKIGMAFAFSNRVFAANFNPVTGDICDPVSLESFSFANSPYGLEFSPDATKMYFSLWYSGSQIFQYNFATNVYQLYTPNLGSPANLGEIELGRDGKLYVVEDGGNNILVVDNPNDDVPEFSLISIPSTTGLGISDPIQSDIIAEVLGDTLCRAIGSTVTVLPPDQSIEYWWSNGANPNIPIDTGSTHVFTMIDDTISFIARGPVGSPCYRTFRYLYYPIPNIDAGSDHFIELGQSVQLEATCEVPNTTFIWFPSESLDNGFTLTPVASPTQTTTYFVSAQNQFCQGSDQVIVKVGEIQRDTVCAVVGQNFDLTMPAGYTNITWTFADSNDTILSTGSPYNVLVPDTAITFLATGDNTTTNNALAYYITLMPIPALDAGPDVSINSGQSAQLNASNGGLSGYTWTPATALSATNIANPTAAPIVTTTYTVSSYNLASCPASDDVVVIVNYLQTEYRDSLCAALNQPITLSLTAAQDTFATLEWYDEASPATTLGTSNSLNVTGQAAYQTYVCKATDSIGNSIYFKYTLQPNPAISTTPVFTLEGIPATLNVTGGSNYTWTPASLLDNPNSAAPITVPLFIDTLFTVINTTIDSCQSSAQLKVTIEHQTRILVPTAFSPNNDGMNDILTPVTLNVTEIRRFAVYNRWGQKMFETNALNQGWDGRFKGQYQDVGVYVWVIEAVGKDGEEFNYKGNTAIIK